EERLHAARGLADAVLVLDQSDADIALALLAETDAGRDRDPRFGQQTLRKFHRAHRPPGLRDRRPGEHARRWRRNLPPVPAEALDQAVTAGFVELAVEVDNVLRSVQRRDGSRLDRGEGAIIQIGFHPAKRP